MGFFVSTAETRPVEHLFHTTRVQMAAIPHRAAFFDFWFDRRKKKGGVFPFFTPLCGGVKWMMRAEQKRKMEGTEMQQPR